MKQYVQCGKPGHPARHEVGSGEYALCRSTVSAPAPSASIALAPDPFGPSSGNWSSLSQGEPWDDDYVENGELTDRAFEVYASGDCWNLAWNLHHKIEGSEIVLLTTTSDPDLLFHACVRTADGNLLDVFGSESPQDKLARWPDYDLRTVDLGRPDAATYAASARGIPDLDGVPQEFTERTDEVSEHLLTYLGRSAPADQVAWQESVEADEVIEENNDFEGEFGSAPDTLEMVADHLGVRERDVAYVRTAVSLSDYAHRADLGSWEEDGEQEYIKGMAEHLRAGGELPPLVAANVPNASEPYLIVDGNHRVAAYALAGIEEIPVFLGSIRQEQGSTPVQVQDATGNLVEITPGELTDEAREVYRGGQCLAMARALAQSDPDLRIVLALSRPGDTWWESETHGSALGEQHLSDRSWVTDFVHAAVVTPDGDLIDVDGWQDFESFQEDAAGRYGTAALVYATPEHLDAIEAHPATVRQDVDLARSFTDELLEPPY